MPCLYQRFQTVATTYPTKVALIVNQDQYSYAQLLHRADRWASVLLNRSSGQRPRVVLLTDQALDYIPLALAIARLDGVCIPTNVQLTDTQLSDAWSATDANLIVAEAKFLAKASRAAPRLTCITSDLVENNDDEQPLVDQQRFPWAGEQDYLITLSSGSTGAPKPIILSQSVKQARAQQTWELYKLTADDVVLCASPFFHSLGQRLVFVPLLLGSTLVHLPAFTPQRWLSAVETHKVSFVISVSSHLYGLKDSLLSKTKQIRTLRTIVTSSAPIDTHFKELLFKAVGCDFHEIYGATEIAVASNLAPEHARAKYMTVGNPCDGIRIEILDDQHNEITDGGVGEIAVRTPLAFSGYYNRPDLTEQASHNNFFLTGDLGCLDKDGFLTYVSRKKDVIISGGINIYPGDIESVLAEHGDLREVATIGVEDAFLGEAVIAVCIAKDRPGLERELRRLANKNLAAFQRPIGYFFVDQFPLTASGKISKLELRATYNALGKDWSLALRALLYGEG